MQYRTLGRTGLNVSLMGIGGGGPSRLGQRDDRNTEAESIAIVRRALKAGVNFIDTAEAYHTERIVGQAIEGFDRAGLVISTKKSTWQGEIGPEDVRESLEASLERLGTDYIDIYHLHGVRVAQYDYLLDEIVPTLLALRDEGKIRFTGITEAFNPDPNHRMLQRALQDDVWDVMMVGFNILNQTARETVFSQTIARDIGVLVMFAVRLAFSRPERLKAILRELMEQGKVDPAMVNTDDPLGFVLAESDAVSLADAAYRFCMCEPGTHVILSGTGSMDHVEMNLESFDRGPLPEDVVARLKTIFAHVDSVSGQ